jgi:hypothetical protein
MLNHPVMKMMKKKREPVDILMDRRLKEVSVLYIFLHHSVISMLFTSDVLPLADFHNQLIVVDNRY